MSGGYLIILFLILASAFFSLAEISLAASRRMKLKVLADNGDARAVQVLAFQDRPGMFFTTVQIGFNLVTIPAGIVGDALLAPYVNELVSPFLPSSVASGISFVLSFVFITFLFVFFGDLIPMRIAMALPENMALKTVGAMKVLIALCQPLGKIFNTLGDLFFRITGLPEKRSDVVSSDDIYAVMEAGAISGVLRQQEHEMIGNVFELDSRTVPSAMTVREDIVYFNLRESEDSIREKISEDPHATYLVCDGEIDKLVGYVDSKDLLERVLKGKTLSLEGDFPVRLPLIIPDTLTLAEALEQFKGSNEDLAVVLNEYALVVGIISLKDIMVMLMGNLGGRWLEEQIMKRDENSWLVEGSTPIDDVMKTFDIDDFPHSENYETIGGFMMCSLRRIPRRMDSVVFAGYKFEVVDIDNYKIDQILVTKIDEKAKEEKKQEDKNTAPPDPFQNSSAF